MVDLKNSKTIKYQFLFIIGDMNFFYKIYVVSIIGFFKIIYSKNPNSSSFLSLLIRPYNEE